jgi:hypothetical protein
MYLGGDEALTSREWVDAHVKVGHGPLGALYPMKTWTTPNPHGTMKEGDTPSWFYFLENGLSDAAHPDWGSWGGRFRHSRDQYWVDAPEGRESVFRWREAFQNDFAARMDACAGKANRAPSAILNGDRSTRVLEIAARVGRAVRTTAAGSVDPEGNHLSFRWYHYPEPGGQAAETAVEAKGDAASFTPPDEGDYHIVLEVRDGGNPELTSYRRAVVRAVR